MSHRSWRANALVLAAILVVASSTSTAGTFDFLFSARYADDDREIFLNLAVANSGYGRHELEPILPRLRHVETDLPVILFLARHSGRSVGYIAGLRIEGHSWSVIFGKVGVSMDVLFAGMGRDPGPPYGKAWGHWKKRSRSLVIADADVVGLVEIQLGHRISGVAVFELAQSSARGTSVHHVVAGKKSEPEARKPAKGHGAGRGKAKGHGKGH
jgi:hypothetical protein